MSTPRRRGVRAALLSALFALLPGAASAGAADALADKAVDVPRAPRAWLDYAHRVSDRFEAVLASDAPDAQRIHAFLSHDTDAPAGVAASSQVAGAPQSLDLKVWIGPQGQVTRVELPPLGDAHAEDALQHLLVGRDIGAAPPHAMRQPVRVRLRIVETATA